MLLKIFSIYDKVSKTFELGGVAPNHQMFIRENVPYLVKFRPLSDLELIEVGTFETASGVINSYHEESHIRFDWSEYNFPETRAAALSPLNLESSSEKRLQYEEQLKQKLKTQGE